MHAAKLKQFNNFDMSQFQQHLPKKTSSAKYFAAATIQS
jgi:hypothetical protein